MGFKERVMTGYFHFRKSAVNTAQQVQSKTEDLEHYCGPVER